MLKKAISKIYDVLLPDQCTREAQVEWALKLLELLGESCEQRYRMMYEGSLKYLTTLLIVVPALYYLYIQTQPDGYHIIVEINTNSTGQLNFLLLLGILSIIPFFNLFFILLTLFNALSLVGAYSKIGTLFLMMKDKACDFFADPKMITQTRDFWSLFNIFCTWFMYIFPISISVAALAVAGHLSNTQTTTAPYINIKPALSFGWIVTGVVFIVWICGLVYSVLARIKYRKLFTQQPPVQP